MSVFQHVQANFSRAFFFYGITVHGHIFEYFYFEFGMEFHQRNYQLLQRNFSKISNEQTGFKCIKVFYSIVIDKFTFVLKIYCSEAMIIHPQDQNNSDTTISIKRFVL